MKLPSIFKTPKNKVYKYLPRYYNPAKDRELRVEKTEDVKTSMRRVRFRDEWKAQQQSKGDRGMRIRLVVIICLLFMITVFALRHFKQ